MSRFTTIDLSQLPLQLRTCGALCYAYRRERSPTMSQQVERPKNPHAVALSRLAAAARLAQIPAKRRQEIARHAARTRWAKQRGKGK
jgi:hypothetical protein